MAKRGRDWSTKSGSSPNHLAPLPLGPNHCTPDDDPPARKDARAVASAMSPDDADVSSAPTSPLPLRSAHRAQARSFRTGQPRRMSRRQSEPRPGFL